MPAEPPPPSSEANRYRFGGSSPAQNRQDSGSLCSCWPPSLRTLLVFDWSLQSDDRESRSSSSVIGPPCPGWGLGLPPLFGPLTWFWRLWTRKPLSWGGPGTKRSARTPASLEVDGTGGSREASTSAFPFSATGGAYRQQNGSEPEPTRHINSAVSHLQESISQQQKILIHRYIAVFYVTIFKAMYQLFFLRNH